MPSADSSPRPRECRYDRPGTAFRDPIPAFVSYFWVAPVWSSRRNWCLGVVHFACSSSSTSPPYFPNAYLLSRRRRQTRLYVFTPLAGGLKTPLKNHLYNGPSNFGALQDIHFSSRFFFSPLRNFHSPFSLSSRSLTYQSRVSANPESLSLARILSQIEYFYDVFKDKSVTMSFVNLFYPPLSFCQLNHFWMFWWAFFLDFFFLEINFYKFIAYINISRGYMLYE